MVGFVTNFESELWTKTVYDFETEFGTDFVTVFENDFMTDFANDFVTNFVTDFVTDFVNKFEYVVGLNDLKIFSFNMIVKNSLKR